MESKINIDPVIVIHEDMSIVDAFWVVNEGWGKVVDPTFKLGIERQSTCGAFPSKQPTVSIARPTFDEDDFVHIDKEVPPSLKQEGVVCVFGEMHFASEDATKHSLKFHTLVSLVPPGRGKPVPPEYLYDVFLVAGKGGYTKRIPISQEIKPGEVDHFLVRIGTDKSASFNLAFAFTSMPKIPLEHTHILLSVFVPRSHAQAALFSEYK